MARACVHPQMLQRREMHEIQRDEAAWCPSAQSARTGCSVCLFVYLFVCLFVSIDIIVCLFVCLFFCFVLFFCFFVFLFFVFFEHFFGSTATTPTRC